MSLHSVSARFLIGVGAWLLGAGAATGGSLLAVSLLGQGIVAPAPSQQLTVTAVNRALASEAAEGVRESPSATPKPSPSGSPSPVPSPRRLKAKRPAPPATPTPQATSAVLTSGGGSVVAQCQSAGAYLVSWSPQQGYEAVSVIRGPTAAAQAKFGNGQRTVVMNVTCSGGVPRATTTVHRHFHDE